jgi:hypothetical protein
MSIPSEPPPPQNKPRKKRPVDVVSFEDLLAAHRSERRPGELPAEGVVLIGVDVELQRRMAQAFPAAPGSNLAAPNFGAPDNSAVSPSATKFGAYPAAPEPPPSETAKTTAPEPAAANLDAPNLGAPDFDVRDLLVRPRTVKAYTVHPLTRIEDAFTAAERDLLGWLWEQGRAVPGRPEIRLVAGPNGEGARRLATQAGLIYNTFKNISRELATKLAVDIVKPEKNLPAIYAVYQPAAILDRQRQAGFTGVLHKNGGRRELVTVHEQPAPRRPDLTVAELQHIINAPKFGA